MPHFLTPQQKKRYSLTRDRRNCYGESARTGHDCVRRRKTRVNRSYRHAVKQSLVRAEADLFLLDDQSTVVRRTYWKKKPDHPLQDRLQVRNCWKIRNALTSADGDSLALIDALQSDLLCQGTPLRAIQDILGQLRGWLLHPNSIEEGLLSIDRIMMFRLLKFVRNFNQRPSRPSGDPSRQPGNVFGY